MHQRCSLSKGRQALAGHFQSHWIAVEPDQAHLREALKNRFAVSAQTQRGINCDCIISLQGWGQKCQATLKEHRLVREFTHLTLTHGVPLAIRPELNCRSATEV
jgi:hypothetical protein